MRVCLINPPSPFLLDDRVFPPLGLLQVAAVLEEAGHDVYVADLGGVADYRKEMTRICGEKWSVYGITATTPQFPMAIDILDTIRSFDPGKRVLIGGPHSTVASQSCLRFDCVIMGDGEEAILSAIQPGAPHIFDQATLTTKGELKWHWPARHLIDMDSYQYKLGGRRGTSMMLSQGCPYNCSFCCGRTIAYYRRARARNVDDVVKEMTFLAERYEVGSVMAFDDEVNILNEPLMEFCQKIAPLGMKFRGFVKANLFTDQQAEAMAKAGFVDVCTGVESGDDRILGIINKQTTRLVNKRFVELARKHGIRSKAFCSLGHPGENMESANNLKSWIVEAKPDDFDVTVITVYPGTPLWEQRQFVSISDDGSGHRICKYVKESKRPNENGATLFFEELDYAREFAFYKGRPKEYVSHVWTPELSKKDLVVLRDEVEDAARTALGIPYPKRYSGDHLDGANNFEHSYGMGVSPQDSRVKLKNENSL